MEPSSPAPADVPDTEHSTWRETTRARGPLYIYAKRWYFRLVFKQGKRSRPLLSDYSLESIVDHLVVCYQSPDYGRIYAWFESYIEFFTYQKNFPPEKQSFYEVIFGEFPQKPHFDIDVTGGKKEVKVYQGVDIKIIGDEILEYTVASIVETCRSKDIILDVTQDIMVYSSHSEEKRSYHIVMDNWCHADNIEAKEFYYAVISRIPKYKEFVDVSVYSSRQQFRLLNNQKYGSGRPKILNTTWSYYGYDVCYHRPENEWDNSKVIELDLFRRSLVSMISGCRFLPSWVPDTTLTRVGPTKGGLRYINPGQQQQTEELAEDVVIGAIKLLAQNLDTTTESREFPFAFRDVWNNVINLERLAPSFCIICQKVHDNENPRLIVVRGNIFFDCRRNPDKRRIYLGCLTPTDSNPDIIPVPVEVDRPYIQLGDDVYIIVQNKAILVEPVTIPPPAEPPREFQKSEILRKLDGWIEEGDFKKPKKVKKKPIRRSHVRL